jgi:hypothetical protein
MIPVTVVEGGYRLLPESLTALIRMANSANVWRFMTCGRLSSYDTLLEGLAQDLEHMAAELGPFIQEESTMVRERHLPRHRHMPPPINPTSEMV